MGTLHVPTLLEGILEATAAEAHAKARITTLRAALEDEARRRMAADGAAPSWNAPQLGRVRLDPAGDWTATVTDPDAFGSYVAERHPTEAGVVLYLKAEDYADAAQALEFIGVTPTNARVEVRPAFAEGLLKRLDLDVTEERDDNAQVIRTVTALDPESKPGTSAVVPGIGVTRSEAKLVVSLDKDRRTAAIKSGREGATYVVEAAAGDEEEPVDLAELDRRRVELEGMHGDTLKAIAAGHQLGSSGTKAALAERIARAELATGHVIRPASDPNLVVTEWVDQQHGDAPEPPEDAEGIAISTSAGQGRIVEGLHGAPASGIGEALAAAADPDVARQVEREGGRIVGHHDGTPLVSSSPLPEGTEVEEVSEVPTEDAPEPGPGPFTDEEGNAYPPNLTVVPDPEDVAQALAAHDDRVAAERLAERLDGLSREVLRQHAKTLPGVSAAGTKAEVIARLVEAGVTVSAVNETARKARA